MEEQKKREEIIKGKEKKNQHTQVLYCIGILHIPLLPPKIPSAKRENSDLSIKAENHVVPKGYIKSHCLSQEKICSAKEKRGSYMVFLIINFSHDCQPYQKKLPLKRDYLWLVSL